MRSFALYLALGGIAQLTPAQAPTLREVLQKAGIPAATFGEAELKQHVNAGDGHHGSSTYLDYLSLDDQNMFQGAPQFVRYDAQTHAVLRKAATGYDDGMCCGSPLGFEFTEHYALASFHDNPSANTVIVVDKDLQYKTMLYGFEFHEVSPDRVVYIENEIHFAPTHAGRLALADLEMGKTQELYPSQNDPLRDAFATFHAKHMPSQADCAAANDPCEEEVYDEDIDFLGATQTGFQIQVKRSAAHTWVTHGANLDVPVEVAVYTYAPAPDGWRYCAQQLVAPTMMKFEDASQAGEGSEAKSCEPNLKVIPEEPGAFTPKAQGAK